MRTTLRSGLGLSGKQPTAPRFTVVPHAFGLQPGVDPERLNQLVDELEAEEVALTLSRQRPDVTL